MSCWQVGDSLGEAVSGGGIELTQKRQGCRMPVKARQEVQLAYWKANMAVDAAALSMQMENRTKASEGSKSKKSEYGTRMASAGRTNAHLSPATRQPHVVLIRQQRLLDPCDICSHWCRRWALRPDAL